MNLSAEDGTPVNKDRKKFSLDALRIPFLVSPKKSTSDLGKINTATDRPTSSNKILTPISDQDPAESKTDQQSLVGLNDDNELNRNADATPGESADGEEVKPAIEEGDKVLLPHQVLLKPIRSALAQPGSPSAKSARAQSPHRVSFSPSTEQVAEARELALLATTRDAAFSQRTKVSSQESRPRTKALGVKWPPLRKSHSTSDLTNLQRRMSLESTTSNGSSSNASTSSQDSFVETAPHAGAAAAKRRLFRWDKRGIHQMGSSRDHDKGRIAKVKLTKHEVVAARHAKTLEQVINAGMGLHPSSSRPTTTDKASQAGSSSQPAKKINKKLKARPIPVAEASQLKGLKSALLDADMANGIIDRLRLMPVPIDTLQQGIGRLEPQTPIGTAGDHGKERVLTANLPDAFLQSQTAKDDSEVRARSGATMDSLDNAITNSSPVSTAKKQSAAEEALRKYTQASTKIPITNPAKVTARTSSLPTPDAPATPQSTPKPTTEPAVAPIASNIKPVFGTKPLKLVHLDCGEDAAHRRHLEHVDGKIDKTTGQARKVAPAASPSTAGMIVAGAAAAISGVGGFLSARGPSSPAGENNMTSEDAHPTMVRSLSAAALPTLSGGAQLLGSSPLQLLMDPVGTSAQTSGAFEVMANVSGAAIQATQDMSAFHPPLDRMAIFVHWWGFEITLPSATLAYLGTAHSISGAFLSFLQTMAVGGGVPELLPFIKYISTFMEVEYKAIQAQDQGDGVVVAATWFMPLALVPRAWDYPLDGPNNLSNVPPESLSSNLPASGAQTSAKSPSPTKKKHKVKKQLADT